MSGGSGSDGNQGQERDNSATRFSGSQRNDHDARMRCALERASPGARDPEPRIATGETRGTRRSTRARRARPRAPVPDASGARDASARAATSERAFTTRERVTNAAESPRASRH